MTWAVVDHKQQAVWGFGDTKEAAMAHFREVARQKKPCVRPENLEFARLSDDADLDDDGEVLYRSIITEPSPAQGVLL